MMIECPDCLGVAEVLCYGCDGCGYSSYENTSIPHWTCSGCGGNGVMDCETCNGIGEIEDE